MKPINETSHTFIVRIWLETRELKNAEPIWRGVIERVEDNERVYFDHVDKLCAYFAKYLERIGINNRGP